MARAEKQTAFTLEERLEQALVPDREWPYKVPENWCWTRIGSVSEVKGGKRLPQGHALLETPTEHPYIRVTDFYGGSIDVENVKYIEDNTHAKISNYTITDKDIYVSIAGTIGKVGIIPSNFSGANLTENAAKITNISCNVNHSYLMHLLSSDDIQGQMQAETKITTQAKLALFRIAQIKIPLAPLAEQQGIVNRIESLFTKLDEAKEKTQAALDSYEIRKAAIFHKAFTGELTFKWRKEHGVGIESWAETKFKDFCLLKRGFDLPASQRMEGAYPLVSSSGIIDTHNIAQVKGPGVVTGRSGSIGKVFYVEEDYWPLNTTLYAEKLYTNNPKFVFYFLHTFDFKSYSSSTAVPTLNRNMFSDVKVKVPSVPEQHEIVRLLDTLFTKEQQAKNGYVDMLAQIDLIKKSILARAFRGELGTNDPTEESAVEFLKQCIAQQANEKEQTPKKKRKPAVVLSDEVRSQLSSELERDIYLLLQKNGPSNMREIASISKKDLDVIEALLQLESKGLIQKQSDGEYRYVRPTI